MKKCMPILAVFLLLFCMTMLTGCSSERGSVVMNEVCADGKSSYRNENGDGTDWIELYNPGKKEISLKGYILTDKTDKMDYGCILPDLTLPAGGYLVLCAGGEQTDAFTLPFGISAKGESLYLKDASGKLLQSLTIPAMGEDVSYARRQDGSFGLCAAPTPGSENGTEILDSLPENPSGSRSSVTLSITEVATAGGEAGDFVEIHNPTESPILLQGMHLTDDMDTPRKTTLGDVSVPAGGYAVIYCGGENGVNLGLSRSGENLFLLDAYGALVDGVEIPALLAGQSWAKAAGGTFGYCGRPTPGSENTAPIGAEALVEADGTEPVILNEVLMKNRYSIVDTYGNHSDFVELYNVGKETVSLDGYYLTDDFSCPAKASLAGCSIGPGEYLVIFLSGMEPANGEQHVAFSLGEGDDGIMLYHGENRSFQKISFLKDVPEDVSISIGGDGKPEYHAYPTPGGPNATGFASLAAQGAGLTEGVYISEVSAGGTSGDWVEIGNGSMATVDLTGWTVWDGSLNTQKCLALSGKLKAGEYLAINGNALHISSAGDTVVLVDGAGNTRDSFATGDLAGGITSGRSRGSSERRFYAKATRGGANGSGYAGYATVPFFSESGLQERALLSDYFLCGSGLCHTVYHGWK